VAVLVSMVPIYTAVLSFGSRRATRLRFSAWLGLFMGLIGIYLLVVVPSPEIRTNHFSTILQPHCAIEAAIGVQLGCVSWAAGSIYAAGVDRRVPPIVAAGAQMCTGGFLMLLIAAVAGELWTASVPTRSVLESLAALTVIGSVLAYTCYTIALRNLSVTTVSLHAYLNPMVAVALSALVRGHLLTTTQTVASFIVLVGVALALRNDRRLPEEQPAAITGLTWSE
jgi:drug/metabolite transporter (DMT)-like permease